MNPGRVLPVTLASIVLSIAGALVVWLDTQGSLLYQLSFQDFAASPTRQLQPETAALHGQWWRLVTPTFLHFGTFHLVFNLLWLYLLGNLIERHLGSAVLLLLVLTVAIFSNLAQYWMTPLHLFGGMSAVIYGLLGFARLWPRLGGRSLELPDGLMAFMLIWLALGFSGIMELVGLHIANTAHLAGLLGGLLMAGAGRLLLRIHAQQRS